MNGGTTEARGGIEPPTLIKVCGALISVAALPLLAAGGGLLACSLAGVVVGLAFTFSR